MREGLTKNDVLQCKEELLELKSNIEKKADFGDINKLKTLMLEETSKLENTLKQSAANLSSVKSNIEAKENLHLFLKYFSCY